MKRTILLLAALFTCATTMLFSQQLEIKTLGSIKMLPDEILENQDFVQHSNIAIIDVLDDYLVCTRPVNPFKIRPNIFMLAKDLSSAKYPQTPTEYADYSPIYLCKIGDYYVMRLLKNAKQYTIAIYDKHLNFIKEVQMGEYAIYAQQYLGKVGDKHFVKLGIRNKGKYAIATFDEQMNFVKAEPMGQRVERMYSDNNYIYLHNTPTKEKLKNFHNGELIKMDKDMNIIVQKPLTVLYERQYEPTYQMIDTFGYTIFCNYGTYMTIDKETLEQNKLDLPREQNTDTVVYEADRIIRIGSGYNEISVSTCDYKGNALQNVKFYTRSSNTTVLDYRDNKVYAMPIKDKNIAIVAFDIATGAADTVSTFQMEQNPGYAWHVGYDVNADIWKYGDNSYNLAVTTEKEEHINNYFYHGYLSYFHLDQNFQTLKMEEETYPHVVSIERCMYHVLHHCDDYTLMMQYKPMKGKFDNIVTKTEVQYVIWDKFGNRTVMPTDQKASFSPGGEHSTTRRGTPIYYPSIYKIAPDYYYILAGIANDEPYVLLELKVKP